MNLSRPMQDTLTNEIRFVVQRMKDSDDPMTKLYFFSAVHGMAFRIMNLEFDPELAFVHHVLNSAYQTINQRLIALAQGLERVQIPAHLFDEIEQALEGMATDIERGTHTHSALQTIANLAYSTTGNGYYLHIKGMLAV